MSIIGSDFRPQSKKTNFSVILVITPSIIFPKLDQSHILNVFYEY